MKLRELVGTHILDAVDFGSRQVRGWCGGFEDSQVMRFRLDGQVYVAVEDPEDGYRSCLEDLFRSEAEDISTSFEPVRVVARHRTRGSCGDKDDVLELVDFWSGQVVIEVGTEAVACEYPGFVAAFYPEAMTPGIVANALAREACIKAGATDGLVQPLFSGAKVPGVRSRRYA